MESVIKTLQHQRLVQRFSTLLEKPTFNNKDSRIEKQIYKTVLSKKDFTLNTFNKYEKRN